MPADETHEVVSSSYDIGPAAEVEQVMPVSVVPQSVTSQAQPASQVASAAQLSPEMIDSIARRVVEMMSDKVVREVAWDVVPELAELLIKRQLEEKESQTK